MHRSDDRGSAPPQFPEWRRRLSVFAPPLVLVLFIVVLLATMERGHESTERVQATQARIAALRQLRTRLVDAETGQRGFLITGDSIYLEPYRTSSEDAHALMTMLREAYVDDAAQLRAVAHLDTLVDRRLAILQLPIEARVNDGPDAAREALIAGRGLYAMAELRAALRSIEAREQARLIDEETSQEINELVLLLVVALGSLGVLLTAVLTNREFHRYAATLEQQHREEQELNLKLQEQAVELEMQSSELQATNDMLLDQQSHLESMAAELEASNDELQATNAQLEERTEEAEAANRAKAQFLASMSHELRTPLNAIAGYVDLIDLEVHGPVTVEQHRDLDRIRHNSRHLLILISDILNYAKVQAGRLDLRTQDVPLAELAAEAHAVMKPLAAAKRIELTCTQDGTATARGDADRIHQILLNLLGNAIKFTPPGGAVQLNTAAGDGVVRVSVHDNGPGIPAELHGAIFDPFMQARRGAGGELSEGVGLGLSISRDLAHAMHGDIAVESEPGRGSTFTLTLPRGAEADLSS